MHNEDAERRNGLMSLLMQQTFLPRDIISTQSDADLRKKIWIQKGSIDEGSLSGTPSTRASATILY
jgi:hypothetical protein